MSFTELQYWTESVREANEPVASPEPEPFDWAESALDVEQDERPELRV